MSEKLFVAKLQGMIAMSDKIEKYGHDNTMECYTTSDYKAIVAILDSIVEYEIKVDIEMRNISVSSLLSKDDTELMSIYHTTAENIRFWFCAEHCKEIKIVLGQSDLVSIRLKF